MDVSWHSSVIFLWSDFPANRRGDTTGAKAGQKVDKLNLENESNTNFCGYIPRVAIVPQLRLLVLSCLIPVESTVEIPIG